MDDLAARKEGMTREMVNDVTLVGYVTRDPEVKSLEGGQTVGSTGLATHRIWRNGKGERVDQTEFHELVIWGKAAERAQKILAKGRLCYIRGSLKTDHWEKDGVKRQQTRVVVDEFRVLDKPERADDQAA